MKKRNLFGALATGMLLCACSSDNDAISQDLDNMAADGSQKLILNLSSGGDKMTRAGRPLYSSEAKQDVDHIVLYVVANNNGTAVDDPSDDGVKTIADKNVVLVKTIGAEEWANALNYSTGGHGKELEISFKKSNKEQLAKGTYDIYAVAYKNEPLTCKTNYTFNTINANTAWNEDNFYATIEHNATADEVFAGKLGTVRVVEVNKTVQEADGKNHTYKNTYFTTAPETGEDPLLPTVEDKPVIVLNRQVAGITGYFTNIPAKVGEQIPAKIRLVACKKNSKIIFKKLLSAETAQNGGNKSTNIVNGDVAVNDAVIAPYFKDADKTKGSGRIVYEFELSKFFPIIGKNETIGGASSGATYEITGFSGENRTIQNFADLDINDDGVVGYKDAQCFVYKNTTVTDVKNWNSDIKGSDGAHNALENYWKNKAENQGLVAGSVFAGEFVIPFAKDDTWNTLELQLLDSNDNILKAWNVADNQTPVVGEDTFKYSIFRNHMYSLGLKVSDGTDPKPNPDPDPDPDPEDQPEDLSKGENLLLHVNDNWEIIHQMEID